ncbi:MAG: transglutaminase domain-containing protein [Bacteroidales bacterium]|nr:transglutaminase domain-containing protein [Bacteroidales bacterium]
MKKLALLLALTLISTFGFAQKQDLSPKERLYLNFLYQYMPLSDRLDYDTNFYIKQVKTALEARETFSWGTKIPEDIFKHFVMVYRVNNENLDTARVVMFNALKDRIKGMSMYEAALEVNHWCHEYVNYKGSDGRTSAPLATMRTSWGRCGEESTFTVTALRSVCIPARQCYTPRWAHTDDNHAWVEVWIDGQWYFLGACEPEAKLNVAWFTAPAKRAMMVHTTVFGKYNGKEETNFVADKYSKINLLENYAPTKKIAVSVVDEKGKAVKDAKVEFGLYNYAEYYPIVTSTTNQDGKAEITTGLGELVIWASKGDKIAQAVAAKNANSITLTLKKSANLPEFSAFTLTPPSPLPIETLDEELVRKNNERLVFEDSIRNDYIATFPNDVEIETFCEIFPPYTKATINDLITRSCGNYENIESVLLKYRSNEQMALKILKAVYDKDLRDVDSTTFFDHIDNCCHSSEYVYNPRIALEKITPWRSFIKNYFAGKTAFKDGKEISKWIDKNIKLNTSDNYYGVPISPEGVLTAKESDKKSKEILFVAVCRTFGIEARYEWATGRAQYRMNENEDWQYAFKEKKSKENNNCTLVVNNDKRNSFKPEYYSHFTIQKLQNGRFHTLDYEYDPKFASFPETLKLSEGQYRMVVGNRNSDGKVYVNETYFTLEANKTKTITVSVPDAPEDVASYGKVDLDILKNSKTKTTVLAIIDGKEPSRHLLVDIEKSKADFDNEDVDFIFVKKDETISIPTLPQKTTFVEDNNGGYEKQILNTTGIEFLNNYPILTLIRKDTNEIIYFSQGYKISSQEDLLKNIKKIK